MLHDTGFRRRTFLTGAGAAVACATLPARAEASFPKGVVRFIVPLAAGGVADVATRALMPDLERIWKQPVIVENKPGGMFSIGMQATLQAPPDGHTLMYLFNSIATIQVVYRKFDLQTQLLPVTQSTVCPMILMVGEKSRFQTIRDLVAYGKANPGKLTHASLGQGSIEHLKAVQLQQLTGFTATNVPYKSGPDMVKDVIGGVVDFVLTIGSFGPLYVPSGKARVLAVLDDKRMPQLPDAPTMTEAGVRVPSLDFWGGYAVRGGTPAAIVQQLHRDIARVAASPVVAEKIAAMTLTPVVSGTPADFRKVISSDLAWMTEVAKGLDLKPEN